MTEQIYKDFFEEAMNQIHEEYIAEGKERDFRFYFNLEYVEETFDTITVSVPSEFMWKQMEKNGSAEKIQKKICELTAQVITLIPQPKNSQISTKKTESVLGQQVPHKIERSEQHLSFGSSIQSKLEKPIQSIQTESMSHTSSQTTIPQSVQPETSPIVSQQSKNTDTETTQKPSFVKFQQSMEWLNKVIEDQKRNEDAQKKEILFQNTNQQAFEKQTLGSFVNFAQPNVSLNQNAIQNSQSANNQLFHEQTYNDYNDEYQRYVQTEALKMQQRSIQSNHPLLREDYTFENFIPGASTQYAYSASKRAAETPGKDYNPMLIYGGVGLGKTHLMQAIGNFIYENNPKSKICYISAESFTNEFTASIRAKKTEEFKKKYRSLDVLLLDDIQFLKDKEATQEELFHTFNAIYDRKGQLVFTCDRPLVEIQGITDRLRTRFTRGLNLDLQPPDYETRRAILEQKMTSKKKKIPLEVLDYIAQNIQSNVRDLESCMLKMIGYSDLIEQDLTIDIAKELLRDKISADSQMGSVSVESVQNAVAKHYNLKLTDLIGPKKKKQFVLPRQIAIYVCRKLVSEYTLTDIGKEFGGRDHSTISSAIENIEKMIKTNAEIAGIVKQIEKESRIVN